MTRRKTDKGTVNELELNGAGITNSTELAEGFNRFFAEIGPELSRDKEEVDTSFGEFVNPDSSCFSFQRVTQLTQLCKTAKRMSRFNLRVPHSDIQSLDRHWYFPR